MENRVTTAPHCILELDNIVYITIHCQTYFSNEECNNICNTYCKWMFFFLSCVSSLQIFERCSCPSHMFIVYYIYTYAESCPMCDWCFRFWQLDLARRIAYSIEPNGSLLLQPLIKDHHGVWVCSATNRVASVQATTQVFVLGECKHKDSYLKIPYEKSVLLPQNASWFKNVFVYLCKPLLYPAQAGCLCLHSTSSG